MALLGLESTNGNGVVPVFQEACNPSLRSGNYNSGVCIFSMEKLNGSLKFGTYEASVPIARPKAQGIKITFSQILLSRPSFVPLKSYMHHLFTF